MKFETPMGLALLLCDTIIEDRQTGKKSLIGLFDRLASAQYPCLHPHLAILVSLTSGKGDYPCRIVCKHLETNTIAFQGEGQIKLANPNQIVDIAFNFHGVTFPEAGVYNLQFLVDDFPVMARRIFLEKGSHRHKKTENGEQSSS